MSELSGAFSLTYQSVNEEIGSRDILVRDVLRTLFQGGIQLNTQGSFYHPNFLSFRANLNFVGFKAQSRYFSDSTLYKDLYNNYDLGLTLFRKKPVSLELFTRYNISSADRAFLERYFMTYKNTGLRLSTRTRFFPFHLEVARRYMLSESEIFREREETTDQVDFRGVLIDKETTKSNIFFLRRDYSEAVYDVNYLSTELIANFLHSSGPDNRDRSSAFFIYRRMTGDFNINRYQVTLNSSHYLLDPLYINLNNIMTLDTSYGRKYKKYHIQGSINHSLYQSLKTLIRIGAKLEDSAFQRTRGQHGEISANYQKKIPTGRLQFSVLKRWDLTGYTSHDSLLHNEEEVNFSSSDAVIISKPGILIGSIFMTAPDFGQVYIQDVDYQVEVSNDSIVILRIPGGAIPRGSTVLIQYDYFSLPDFRLYTRFSQLHLRLLFLKYFTIYARWTSNQQDVRSEFLIPPFESYVRLMRGVIFDSGLLNLDYSTENYEGNLSDYEAQNLRVGVHTRLFKVLNISANYNDRRMDYQPDIFSSRFQALSLENALYLGNGITVNTMYRDIRYTTDIYSRDRESVLIKFQWEIRKIILNFFYEHIFNGYESTTRKHDFFSVMIRRTF
ncbi:MAG: hypothetical protein MUP98_14610 [Candidatus Aminicenantes bacterium]|nr:hypothetical protein [Candidatus Aminicenantes bacterium]